jgi:uncharacterized Fe-S cluster protein YjdI/CDGSH-type Zn-finger protein
MTETNADVRQSAGVAKDYESDAIRVRWESAYCIHSGRCLTALPQVFDAMERPWISINAADADEIAEAVKLCPTGALTFERLDGGSQVEHGADTLIEPRPDGPLFVRGKLAIRTRDGTREATRVALCRCGGSDNKPFCDNTHRRIGFRGEGSTAL